MKKIIITISFLLLTLVSFSQSNSKYSVRFLMDTTSTLCNDSILIDLQIKAENKSFFLADQNYRFSFNDEAIINPQIVEELEISGYINTVLTNEVWNVYYDPHHLNGSVDTIVSYNVVLSGGTGYLIDTTRWYSVGRISFDIVDTTKCFDLKWHTHAPNDFPPTTIIEKFGGFNGTLYELEEGYYYNVSTCNITCNDYLPINLISFNSEVKENCIINIRWETSLEINSKETILESSTNGNKWDILTSFKSDSTGIYNYNDTISNITYYRLKQIDIDGEITIFDKLLSEQCNYEDFINILYTQNNIFINFNTSIDVNLIIYNNLGQIIKKQYYNFSDGIWNIPLILNTGTGIYYAQFIGNNWYSKTKKFIYYGYR